MRFKITLFCCLLLDFRKEECYNLNYIICHRGGVKMKSKRDIYEPMAVELGLTKKSSKEVVDYVFGKISEFLSDGEKVRIDKIGNFEVRERAERAGINPQTGEKITINAKKLPVFKAGKWLKDKVNKA